MTILWDKLIISAGIGQLGLVAASLAIPRALGWPEDLAKLRPLTRQVFWVYAAYIWCTNLALWLISLVIGIVTAIVFVAVVIVLALPLGGLGVFAYLTGGLSAEPHAWQNRA